MVAKTSAGIKDVKTIRHLPSGLITPPQSKSMMHRALICAMLTGNPEAESHIENVADSDDIRATRNALKSIFAKNVPHQMKDHAINQIDCGESGSTLRFLLPIAAMTGETYRFTGAGRLMERPMDVYADIFAEKGAFFKQTDTSIEICGPLPAGDYEIEGHISSQFVTGLLFALSLSEGNSEIRLTTPLESKDYVNLTVDAMCAYGIEIGAICNANGDPLKYQIKGGQKYLPVDYRVENDWSQAAFFLCAAALGRDVAICGMNMQSRQGDRQIVDLLAQMGASVEYFPCTEDTEDDEKGALRVHVQEGGLQSIAINARDIPDIIPPLAATACFAQGETRFRNAGRLRMKESDRLKALQSELSAIGADVHITGDDLVVRGTGGEKLPGGQTDAHNDHRIAMALAVASIGCENPVQLTGWQSVSKSYPNFWTDFEKESRR